jgi:CHAT domain-containing protein
MKFFAAILLTALFIHKANSQCLTGKTLWDSIVYLRQSSLSDSDQRVQMQSFIRKAAACRYDKDSVYILLMQRMGALHSYQLKYQEAISHTWEAVRSFNTFTLSRAISPALQVKNYFNLYLYYKETGDRTNVSKVVDSCILLSVRNGYADKYTLDALDEKSTFQLEAGDYYGCVKTTQLTDILLKSNPEFYSIEEREKMIRLFSTRLNAMIFLQQYNDAELLLESRKVEYLRLNNGNRLGNWYALMGKLKRRQKRFEETIRLLRNSVTCHLKAGYAEGAAESLNNIGFVYLDNLHEYKKALPYFQQALKYATGVESLNILANIGNTFAKLKDYKRAFISFQQAFDQISPGMNEVKILKTRDSSITANYAEYLLRLEMYKGDAYLSYFMETGDQSALHYAISVYKCTDQLLNEVKTMQTDFQSKLFWRSDARQLYEHGIEASRLANNHEVALYFFEKSRAVLLSDQIHSRNLLTKDEFAQYTTISKAIAKLESAEQYFQSMNAVVIENKLFSYRLQLGRLEKLIRERRLMDDQSVVTIRDVHEKILDSHRAFLQIYTGDSAVYIFAITKGNTILNKINKTAYDTLLGLYTGYLSNHTSLNRNFKHFVEVSTQLYSILLKGLKLLPGRLVISSDGTLFPFESLVVYQQGTSIKYLIEDNPVTYTYNARYFIHTGGNIVKGPAQFTGFAPVNYPAKMKLNSLAGSNISLNSIENYFRRTDNYYLTKATRASFSDNYSKSDIIQLYTHGAYQSDRNEPVLFFSDSALYLSELTGDQKPQTKLIVLAACETGLGANYEGEGVFSFSRGFASIGIPSSITTLWAVNKETTFEVTELFYKYLAQGNPADIALQKAKLSLIKSTSGARSLPYYWAGPVLIGNSDPIVAPHSEVPSWILLISLIAAGLAGILAVKRFK